MPTTTARKAKALPSGPTDPPVIKALPEGRKVKILPRSRYPLPTAPKSGALAKFHPAWYPVAHQMVPLRKTE
jgi:hypothetical protein